LTSAVALVGALVLAGCGSGGSDAESGSRHWRGIVQIERVVKQPEFGRSYGGYVTNPHGDTSIYVTRAGMRAMAAALARAGVPVSRYRLVDVTHSQASLERLTMELAHDQAALESQGIRTEQWGPDAASNTVLVLIAHYTAAQARSLQARYGGPGWVTVKRWTGPLHGSLY
jgi:hypothetical protein